LNPGGSIHPVLGSVFSAPKYGRTSDELPWEEEVVAYRDQPVSLQTPSPERPKDFQGPEEASDPVVSPIWPLLLPPLIPENARRNPDANPSPDPRTPVKPLVARDQKEEVAKPAVRSVSEEDQAVQSQELIEPHGRVYDEEVPLKGVYSPIMAEIVGGTAPPSIFGDKPKSLPPAAGTREKRVVSRRNLPSAGAPDEIQIHIGRIEVIAVPQAPAPPAAKPAPKSVSLSEYLKRRDPRAL
jgi:hypothetical protein